MTAPVCALPGTSFLKTSARLSMRGALIAFVGSLLLGLWVWTAVQLGNASNEVMERGETRMLSLTRAFSEHVQFRLEGADQVLRFIRREYLQEGAALDIAACLRRGDVIDAHYHLLSVIGSDGVVLDSSQPFQRVSLRDREHFSVHAQGVEDRLFVSKPVVGRVSHKTSIQVTRRVQDAASHFAGVVVLSLSPEVFTDFRRQDDEAQGDLLLVGLDGIVRARTVNGDVASGHNIAGSALLEQALRRASGSAVVHSSIDGVDRLYAWRTLAPYGLVVFSGLRTELLRHEVRERQQGIVAGAVLMSAVLLGALLLLLRAERRRQVMVERLRESERLARSANETRSRFLRTMSHELRTPLNGILGYAELIRDTSTDPEAREFGAIVHHSAEQLHVLLGTLLDLARIESGRLGLHMEAVALPALLHEVVAAHRATADSRGLALTQDIAPGAPGTVVTDRARLAQVLNHLLTNALKFTEHGGVRVALTPDNAGVLIEVRDSGIGMSAAQLNALFSNFETAAPDYVHRAQGPGLGLPLARELAALLGGSLSIESVEGQGTRALLRLPLRAPAARAASPSATVEPAPTTDTHTKTAHPGAPDGAIGGVQGNDP